MIDERSIRIGIIGYGKMGQAVERIAIVKKHEVMAVIKSTAELKSFLENDPTQVDVFVEFTSPHSVVNNIKTCVEFDKPIVTGTTGWSEKASEIESFVKAKGGTLFYASNFSIGVHLFNQTAIFLSKLMSNNDEYQVMVEETHHTQKKDAPSGTAITLADICISQIPSLDHWYLDEGGVKKNGLKIISKRVGGYHGEHKLLFHSMIDTIELTHHAFSRDGFAIGAIKAAEFITGQKGVYTMDDLVTSFK